CQGMFFASSVAIVLNNFSLVSMHAIGLGGLLGVMYNLIDLGLAESAMPMILSLLLTGLVCTSRLVLGRHTPAEIVLGLLTGLVTQWVAYLL
ncbi:MAG: phosphatase PAP2 family protein, partial [bacterium]